MFSCCQQDPPSPQSQYHATLPPNCLTPRLLNPTPAPTPIPIRKGIVTHFHHSRSQHQHKATQTHPNAITSPSLPQDTATQTNQPQIMVMAPPQPRETLTTYHPTYFSKYSNIKTSLWNSKQQEEQPLTQRTARISHPYLPTLPPLVTNSFTLPVPPSLPPLLRSLPAAPQPLQNSMPLTNISNLFREVVSEVKQEESSLKKPNFTPHRRHLFLQRDTIYSRYHEDSGSEPSQSIRVQQSEICQPQPSMVQYGQALEGEGWVLYQALDQQGQQVSVKEMAVTDMASIAREVEISRQLQISTGQQLILCLRDSQIIQGRYLLIKDGFDCSLGASLRAGSSLDTVTHQISTLFSSIVQRGYCLSTTPQLADFVIRNDKVVLANVGILTMASQDTCGEQEAVLLLRQQMLQKYI